MSKLQDMLNNDPMLNFKNEEDFINYFSMFCLKNYFIYSLFGVLNKTI